MEEILAKLEKKFGKSIFVENEKNDEVEVISTGSLSLDVSTGVGGIPLGKITTVYGAESSGKTTLCLEMARQAILKGYTVGYIDVEQSLDYSYVQAILGDFDIDKLVIAQPETAEESLGIAETFIKGDKDLGIEPGQFKLVIIDSVAALAPIREKEKELTDSSVAGISKLLSLFFRRNSSLIRKNNVALVMVNQVRDNIGSYYGGYVLPGGHALKHYSSMIIFMSTGKKIEKGDEVVGMLCSYVIKKNKLATPFRSYSVPLMFGEGIDYYRDAIEFAEMMGIIKRRGAYYRFEDEQLGQGMQKSIEYLKSHPETLDKISKACYTNLSKELILDEEGDIEND